MSKDIVFDFFRYQLLPKNSNQLNLFEEVLTTEQIRARKNEFFLEAITAVGMYYWDHYANDLPFRIVDNEDEVIVMKLGKKKVVTLTNENLDDEEHPDFPNVVIVINNDPEDQTIAISRDIDSFSNSFVVANILEENFSRACNKYNLEVVVNPILDE